MTELISDKRLARLASDNEPTGDHLSGLTADEVAEILAEVTRLRAVETELRATVAGEHSQLSQDLDNAEEMARLRIELAQERESLALSEAQLVEVTLKRAEWRKRAQQHETVVKVLRSSIALDLERASNQHDQDAERYADERSPLLKAQAEALWDAAQQIRAGESREVANNA